MGFDGFDGGFKLGAEVFVGDRVGVFYRMTLCWCRFNDVLNRLLTCSVDGGEVDDDISGLEDEVAEDSVDSCRSIGYKDTSLGILISKVACDHG